MSPFAAVLFVIIVTATLGVTWWAGRRNTSVSSHLVAGGGITSRKNGLAIAGDFISASSFLGTTGAVALTGFNGYYLGINLAVCFVLALLIVAEPLRNLGQFTLGDVLATRFTHSHVRASISVSSIALSLLYMVAQFVGAALLIVLLFDIPYWAAALTIGVLTTIYTAFGGMLGTTYIQIIKTGLLLACCVLIVLFVLAKFGFNPLTVMQEAGAATGNKTLMPTRTTTIAGIDSFSLVFGVILGTLGLPHVMVRFLTVKSSEDARDSAITAIWIFVAFVLAVPTMAYGALLIVGRDAIKQASVAGNLAMPQLAEAVGGDAFLSFLAAVAFAVILASLSGLVIATSGAVSHDVYAKLIKKGHADPKAEFLVARGSTVVAAAIAVGLAFVFEKQNVAFLATLAIAVAGSANLPGMLLAIYWRKATAAGLTVGMYVGLIVSIVMIFLSPVVLKEDALVPLSSPGIVSIPLGFLVAVVVSLLTQPKGAEKEEADTRFDQERFQAVTGYGAETIRASH